MTKETAQKASDILSTIRALEGVYKRFEDADHVTITAGSGGNRTMDMDIYPIKHSDNNRYIRYIMSGLNAEIQSLQEELARL